MFILSSILFRYRLSEYSITGTRSSSPSWALWIRCVIWVIIRLRIIRLSLNRISILRISDFLGIKVLDWSAQCTGPAATCNSHRGSSHLPISSGQQLLNNTQLPLTPRLIPHYDNISNNDLWCSATAVMTMSLPKLQKILFSPFLPEWIDSTIEIFHTVVNSLSIKIHPLYYREGVWADS